MLMGTMAPAAQGQSFKEGYRGHPRRPSTLKAADGHIERDRDLRGPVGVPPASDSHIITPHFLKIKYKNMINS